MRIRTIASAFIAVVAMGMALTAPTASAAASSQAAASFGPYLFTNDYSHLCMDVAFGSTADGARIQQWDCYGGTPEQWRLDEVSVINGVHYYAFVNMNSGKCLDVPNGSTAAGVELQQWPCWSGDMQQWALYSAGNGSVTIRNLKSGLCVDVKNWGGAGAALQQWYCNNLSVQTWQYN
jgi:hypothetical protein